MTHPIKEILMEELETVSDAIQMGEDMEHWTGRLKRVNHALQSLSGLVALTPQEQSTLLLLIEFHDGLGQVADEAPFNIQAAESARAKLKG